MDYVQEPYTKIYKGRKILKDQKKDKKIRFMA